jgi:hypothetical protein
LPLSRPDLIHGFRDDPRFAGRLDAGDRLDGFIARVPPIPLGASLPTAQAKQRVPVLMPVTSLDDLQPVMALLAGTPDAAAMDLHMIAPRALAEAALADVQSAFRFHGLSGHLVLAPDRAARTVWLDTGLAATDEDADEILVWLPRALPRTPGWLARLRHEANAIANPGALSPALTHEDGSIAFGSPSATGSVVGFSAAVLHRGPPVPVPSPAPDVALLDRAAIVAAGGFAGQRLTETHAHIDLGARLADAGCRVWCSGAVEFWRLDTTPLTPPSPEQRILRRIDARLPAHRGLPGPEEAPP